MRLILLESDSMVSELFCEKEPLYVGAGESCRVRLRDARVAEHQLLIYPDKGAWILQQLHDENAVRVNGVVVHDRVTLKTGDEVQLLEYKLRCFPEAHEHPAMRSEVSQHTVAQLARFAQSSLPPGAVVKKADELLTVLPGQLTKIGQLNLALAPCLLAEDLMNVAIQALQTNFGAQRTWIGIRRVNYGSMEYVEGRTLTGQSCELTEAGEKLKPRILDRGQFIYVPMWSAEERISIVTGPLAGPDGILGMLYMDSGDSGRKFDLQDLDYFILMANLLAVQLDAIFKLLAQNRAAAIEGQISVAHEIQARLTPRKLPQWEQLSIGAFREPGRERTGDIYDVLRLATGNAAVMVAHTSAGGGLPSMLMSQSHAAFRVAAMHQDPPHVFLRSLNWMLYDGLQDRPLDCFTGIIEPATGRLQYAMAGQMGAYIISARGEERRLGPSEPTPPLSLVKNANFPLLTEELEPQETLVLFTPGVTTAKNFKGDTFGEDRFVNILCDGFGQLASQLLKEMMTDLQNFTQKGVQPDDITVLLVHRMEE